ncbi:hypothetical protein BZG36_01314 [Bifiguratus adelaidae]|uniref:beta-N-acetylhexosaminidase n=1 Tax=Bifiguratus adelaidae TaxID=1938954 RepID=A0A261Y547_9FUNG|nr:hypothetical protein BZG36_01314 [Bifiguratus adelaidae]
MLWAKVAAVALCLWQVNAEVSLPQIPSLTSFSFASSAHTPGFELSSSTQIVVDRSTAGSRLNAQSPSLLEFAETFRDDLADITGQSKVRVVIGKISKQDRNIIYLTIGNEGKYKYNNGQTCPEAYELDINEAMPDVITVTGSSALGTFWGTRSLLQQIALHQTSSHGPGVVLPAGHGIDVPGWEVRGFMLDAGRHWFDTGFLSDLCTYASFWKINEFHVHAMDNLWSPAWLYGPNANWREEYSGFRFRPPPGSPFEGLVHFMNETWTRSEFEDFEATCAKRGVTVIPEIESPGHALAVSQWKPELMIAGSPDSLNISQPDMIPTIKSIWKEFLPWFTSKEVHIGADEYPSNLANDYIRFVNTMADYIFQESGKRIRIWGTLEPSKTMEVSKNITIQHWDFPSDDLPVQLMAKGYHVINSEQAFLYLDGKSPGETSFPQELNQTLMWTGAPGGAGWAPNIFTTNDPSNNSAVDEPFLRGAIMPLWSDWGNNATTRLEVYYSFAKSLATLGLKTWSGSGEGTLARDQFEQIYPLLNAVAPCQNLNRVVPSKGKTVVEYDFGKANRHGLPDQSGNHYNAQLHNVATSKSFGVFKGTSNSYATTPLNSMGPPYTMSFKVNPASGEGTLFSGIDSILLAADLTWNVTGQLYTLNYSLPINKVTQVEIHATREQTWAYINGEKTPRYWYTYLEIWGDYIQQANMSFAAPIQTIGAGFKGMIGDIVLTQGA